MKISATALGETAGDFFSFSANQNFRTSTIEMLGLFIFALSFQLKAKSYKPLIYGAVIFFASAAGTTMSDLMNHTMALGSIKSSFLTLTVLISILGYWRYFAGSLSFDIKTSKVEILYWIAIMFSNTLGTSLGDYILEDTTLGIAESTLLLVVLLSFIIFLSYLKSGNKIILFWLGFVLTRPFGAIIGTALTKPIEKGGLNLDTFTSSFTLLAVLGVCLTRMVLNQKKLNLLNSVAANR